MIHAGIDLVNIDKIKKVLARQKTTILKRVCTTDEIKFLKLQKREAEKFAAYWGLKEAFSKALGTGIGQDLSFQDIQITYTKLGQPKIKYVGQRFNKNSKKWNYSCSVSHQDQWLVAIVIIMGEIK
ncbi:MAG: holo-ACP synthase [Oligoflexia bacterium]|nr:holo-ACP synthase [Oligoflexia bacterium]